MRCSLCAYPHETTSCIGFNAGIHICGKNVYSVYAVYVFRYVWSKNTICLKISLDHDDCLIRCFYSSLDDFVKDSGLHSELLDNGGHLKNARQVHIRILDSAHNARIRVKLG